MIRGILLLLCFPLALWGQNTIGFPDVINYPKTNYLAGTQNWEIRQDSRGIMYFANNEGLLSFDGRYWALYPLPNKTIVRSVEINNENRIYVGGQDELGYFSPDASGRLSYTSLISSIPEKERSFGDVWDILTFQSSVFFRTGTKIFKYTGRAIEVFSCPSEWMFMGLAGGNLFAQDSRSGLMEFKNNAWSQLSVNNKLLDLDPITSLNEYAKDTLIVTTLKSGVFKLTAAGFEKYLHPDLLNIEKQRIYSAIRLNDNWMAIATTIGGLFITDRYGNLIQHFSKEEGLQNNNILTVFLDKKNNLWLGLDNGIDCIAYNSAVKHIHTSRQDGSGYAAVIENDNLYLGTSAGLFYTPLQQKEDISYSKGMFLPVENSTGQTWSIESINGTLLMGHHEGAFQIENNKAVQIAKGAGFWTFRGLTNVSPITEVIAGNYKGISLFQLDSKYNRFALSSSIPDFNESSRYVERDQQGNIWISHPYHGVYRISLTPDGLYKHKLYTEKNGLPYLLNNQVFKLKNEIVFATEKGIYTYDEKKDRFEPNAYYARILGQQSIRYVKEDTDGNIWFIHEKNLGVVDMSGKKPEVNHITELNNKLLSGFELIYPVNAKNILIGGEDGFYHINYQKYKANRTNLSVRLCEVTIFNQKDSILYGGYSSSIHDSAITSKAPHIDNEWKNIVFRFSAPCYGQVSKLEYSYRLNGFDNNWSEWTEKSEKEYTNLPPGSYSFEIKARYNMSNESAAVSYSFVVLPPWYRTNWAYLIYAILFSALILMLIRRQRNKLARQKEKHEEEQKKMQTLHQLEINEAEKELMALRNEKLQTDIDFKNSELATTAMHLVQKGELISKIKNELNHIIKGLDNEKAINEIRKMIKMLSDDDKMDKDWENFTQHFDKIHSDFVAILKEIHGNLSPNEIKLCTYLRMNLSTKEIAQLMNISVRGVEISRYRLRKKLGIPTETSLFDYLINLGAGKTTKHQKDT